MLHLKSFTGFSIHLECWNAFRWIWSIERKVKKNFWDIQVWFLWRSSRDLLRTSWGRPDLTSQGRPLNVRLGRPLNVILERPQDVRLGASPGHQIRTSPGWSNRIIRGRPEDVGGGCPRNILWTNIYRLGRIPWVEWTYH